MANDFLILYRQQAKKEDIGRYLSRIGRYLKQGTQELKNMMDLVQFSILPNPEGI